MPNRMYTRENARRFAMLPVGLALFTAAAAGASEPSPLRVQGTIASKNVRTIGGQAYVPLQDIASALNMTVVTRNGGYELVTEGGAGQLQTRHTGKLGQEVFTGKWRFAVTSVERARSYRKQLTPYYRTETQAQEGDELVLVRCRVKNGTTKRDSLVYDKWEGNNTALTDMQGHSYAPVMWDVRADQIAPEGAEFLPGAAVDFVLVFSVPRGTELKDLVFTAIRYDDRTAFEQKKHSPTDIRYGLR